MINWRYLSSMHFAFVSLVAMALWFFVGMMLTLDDSLRQAMREMNHQMLADWFFYSGIKNPMLATWFIVFCFLAMIMAFSITFCTVQTLLRTLKNKRDTRSILLFSIHLNFIIILFFHVITLLTGFKEGAIEMFPGEVFKHRSGYSFTLKELRYVDNVDEIAEKDKKSRRDMPPGKFSYKINHALFVISRNDAVLAEGKSFVMQPYIHEDIRITLEKFVAKDISGKKVAGVKCTFVKNNLIFIFFIFYALEVLLILLFLLLTWSNK
jgi:protein-S-isoprenylcysteine O-methyltransferase Ste14